MLQQEFKIPAKLKNTSLILLAIGIITFIAGAIVLLMSKDQMAQNRFWAVMLQNSVFFLLICLASVFILSATSLAQGAWIVAFRRIPESIGSIVWIMAIIAGTVLLSIVWTNNDHIYKWVKPGYIEVNSLKDRKSVV